ncbi:hypothetical protein KKE06_03910 [Candidatus Micrarchaeota archaeon]|nr:hypothetical protein [Candidatus Micrarchaeota archaeon]MBU1930635.1 hypothetical protein [Candidatus Micrarchaeota archaeon]
MDTRPPEAGIDCGSTLEVNDCLLENGQTCTPSFGEMQFDAFVGYAQVVGVVNGKCQIFVEASAEEASEILSATMNCEVPQDETGVFALFSENIEDYCTGMLAELIKEAQAAEEQ